MICDCHTHIWQNPAQLGAAWASHRPTLESEVDPATCLRIRSTAATPAADADYHLQQLAEVNQAFVLGFVSRYTGTDIPNRYIGDYVAAHPGRFFGFAGIDPTHADARQHLREARLRYNLCGAVVSPACQDFHPADSRAIKLYGVAEELAMPLIVHQPGTDLTPAKLEFARPSLWDEILRDFPGLTVVFTQLGWPWIDETLMLLTRHPRCFADLSGVARFPVRTYHALLDAVSLGVADKLLFGSDFPFFSVRQSLEALYSLNSVALGSEGLLVPRAVLRQIVERDAAALLGIGERTKFKPVKS